MKKTNFILIITLLFSLTLTSCQSVKDGLTGKKQENSDEFLVKKKNPLVMPPDYMKLPKPDENSELETTLLESETDIQKILEIEKSEKKVSKNTYGNAEDFVLENIKN